MTTDIRFSWFESLVALHTGWAPGEVFSMNPGTGEGFRVLPALRPFCADRFDVDLLHKRLIDSTGTLTFDLPGFAAWMLSRSEEHGNQRWAIGRRTHFDSTLMAKKNLHQVPVVDRLIENFCQELIVLRGLRGRMTPPIKRPWPDGKKAAVCFTHDVDLIDGRTALWARRIFWRLKLAKALLGGDRDQAKHLREKLRRWSRMSMDPVWSIPKWVAEEEHYGIRSTYFFLALSGNLGPEGRRYSHKHPRLREAISLLTDKGFEVGLHGASHFSYSLPYLSRQADRLEKIGKKPIRIARQHYLNTRYPTSWKLMARAGFDLSSNLAWSGPVQGFRAGTCWPYFPGRIPGIEGVGNLMEIPFQVMDRARIEDVDAFVGEAKVLLRQVKSTGGVFVVNFHTDYYDSVEAPGVHEAWTRIVRLVREDESLWVAPLGEAAEACKKAQAGLALPTPPERRIGPPSDFPSISSPHSVNMEFSEIP